MKEKLRSAINDALMNKFHMEPDKIPAFSIEIPNQPDHGDLASNVAMLLARHLKRPPRQIAGQISDEISSMELIEKVQVAGPGFLNVFFKNEAMHMVLLEILEQGKDFGRTRRTGASPVSPVMVEFVSANPTGPLHFGHGRGAVIGDVLANLLSFSGVDVTREYYVNDAGRQVRNLALSVVWRLREINGLDGEFPPDGYRGEYVTELAKRLPAELTGFLPGEPDGQQLEKLQRFAVDYMLNQIKKDLDDFGVSMDNFFSEKRLLETSRFDEAIDQLQQRGVIEQRDGATWFLSDRFGDDKPRVLVKSSGDHTYFATDVAYHLDKLHRGFEALIDVWGADHHGYVARMKAALEALGRSPDSLDVLLVQMVRLLRGGEPVKMSKRSGKSVTLREVFEEVGRDAARFFFLLRNTDSQMEFDLELAKSRTMDNPVYYAQYGHARLCSILTKAEQRALPIPTPSDVGLEDLKPLDHPDELQLMKKMASFAEQIRKAADSHAPHLLVYYLQDLVARFHSYYTNTKSAGPILKGKPDKIAARLVLVLALRQVLRNAFMLLGVSAPERMDTPEGEGQ